jgi:hypothetical protein
MGIRRSMHGYPGRDSDQGLTLYSVEYRLNGHTVYHVGFYETRIDAEHAVERGIVPEWLDGLPWSTGEVEISKQLFPEFTSEKRE